MTQTNNAQTPELPEQPFMSHLVELRDRLLRVVVGILVVFFCLLPFQNEIFEFLAAPLMSHLPEGTSMLGTKTIGVFLTPLKGAFVCSIYLSIPYIFHQMWGFIAPGLYLHERKLVLPLLVSSSVLFYTGMAFAYFVVFPILFDFLPSFAPEGIQYAPDISDYLSFVLTIFFAFGIAFEVPIATIIAVRTGMTTVESLKEKRPYVIIGAFVVGMFLTPPDAISQTLLAIPMWMLFEAGLYFARGVKPEESSGKAEPAADTGPAPQAATTTAGSTPTDYQPMTENEMDAELDRIEAEEQEALEAEGKHEYVQEGLDEELDLMDGDDENAGDDQDGARKD